MENMKDLIRIPLAAVMMCAACGLCKAQEFYRGEMSVTGQEFSLEAGRLNVDLSVDFKGLRMPADESLTVTPILANGDNEQELPAVLINGAKKEKAYRREQAFAPSEGVAPIPAVVIRNAPGMAQSFRYRVAVPYEPWMESATLLLRSQECACHGKEGAVYKDRIAERVNLAKIRTSVWDTSTDRKYLARVNFVAPPARDESGAENFEAAGDEGRQALRPEILYAVAQDYPKGSTEYNDLLDLAARLFPDSPEANINAAAVALVRRDPEKARRYLERFATLPAAYNNMGVLCLLEGNRGKAEVYLTMAAAAGMKQAERTLKEMKNDKE